MSTEIEPIVGEWYEQPSGGQVFQVVAVNEDAETVEVQLFDGDIAEFSFEDWYELDLVATVEPEDFSGPYDNMDAEDMGYSDTGLSHTHWGSPLDDFQD